MTLAGLALTATALGGCQSIFGSNSMAQHDLSDIDMTDYFAERLAMGKRHLEAGRPTRAITAFRQASYDPRFAGEAFNGMAIAYDRIGRADLAARYFANAVAAAPEDERFARNLARLEGKGVIIPHVMPDAQPVDLAVRETAPDVRGSVTIEARPMALSGAVRVEKAPETRVARLSRAEVAVGEATTPVVRTAAVRERPARITVETSRAERVAMRARRNAQARKAYPIRIVLREQKTTAQP